MEQKEISTIKLTKEVKNLLKNLKIHRRETYQDIIERLMKEVKTTIDIIEKEGQTI